MRSRSHMIAMIGLLGALGALAGVDALKAAESAPPSRPPEPKRRRGITAGLAAAIAEPQSLNTSREQERRLRQMARKAEKDARRSPNGGTEHG